MVHNITFTAGDFKARWANPTFKAHVEKCYQNARVFFFVQRQGMGPGLGTRRVPAQRALVAHECV